YFYSAADVCVMPSYSESFGLVGLEAQACGRPVVGSDVAGLRSVVRDDVSGYLIDGHEPAAYAERIGRLLDNPELAQQMGRRGRLLAQRFSWTRTADRLQGLFEGMVERAQGRVPSAFISHTWLPLRNAIWCPSGDETGDDTSIAGSEGRAAARLRAAGGETTLMTKALCREPLGVDTAAEKTRCVESGSHAGLPMSPAIRVLLAAAPVRLRTRRLVVERSCRRYAIRLAVGAHETALTGAESSASSSRARKPTS